MAVSGWAVKVLSAGIVSWAAVAYFSTARISAVPVSGLTASVFLFDSETALYVFRASAVPEVYVIPAKSAVPVLEVLFDPETAVSVLAVPEAGVV